jgi:hypothetical protein
MKSGALPVFRVLSAAALFSMAICIPVAAAPAGHQGIVAAVEGDVSIHRADGRSVAKIQSAVQIGDTIVAKLGSYCSGITPNGNHFELKGPGRIVFTKPKDESLIDKIKEYILLQISQLTGQRRSVAAISRGAIDFDYAGEPSAPIMPADGGRVRASSQSFFWKTVHGIDDYVVTIETADGDATTYTVRGHSMTRDDLEPGQKYFWKVIPTVKDLRASARLHPFTVMQHDEEKMLDASLEDLPDLECGVLLLSAGLHGEAILRFKSVISSGTNVRSATQWKSRAMADMGLYQEAYETLDTLLERD